MLRKALLAWQGSISITVLYMIASAFLSLLNLQGALSGRKGPELEVPGVTWCFNLGW